MWEEENEGWCGSTYKYSYKSTYKYLYKSTYKYTYNLTYKYLEVFPEGEGDLWEGGTRKGFRFFLGFSWAFAPVANS